MDDDRVTTTRILRQNAQTSLKGASAICHRSDGTVSTRSAYGRGRAKAAPRIKQPRRADPVWFPLRVTLAQPRGEGQNVRSSSRAISLKSFSGSNADPLSTNSCSSRIVLFGAK
jgi:hypothetical protein